ncbi:MAG: type 1 glutamine amidotransferase [Pseudorhodoplanes sp.]|uniref:type 1 glutamine amidotransferase n=1 Tax=Pseudorhodoplanes sp. TaxID=1934341 RepID=UPI003D1401ED
MPAPRLLVIEGNTADGRSLLKAAGGEAPSEGYAGLLREFLPQAAVDICYPADPGANLPDSAGLESYDGVVITGSALHVYDRGPHIDPQIELARAVFDSSTPLFGSCWGLQVITTAAGGSVRRNPKGREIGFGRRIRLTAPGRGHPVFAGKDEVFDAVTIHLDEVETLAPNMQVLALNAFSAVQAAEVKVNGCTAWGVQYHPEYSLADIAASFRRHGKRLIEERFFNDHDELNSYAETVAVLHEKPTDKPRAWRLGLDATVLDKSIRTREVRNWIHHQVLPTRSQRGRE